MTTLPKTCPLLMALLVFSAAGLPVAVKNASSQALDNYPLLIIVDRSLLEGEGVDPGSMCVVDNLGGYLPYWIIPQTLDADRLGVYVVIPHLDPGGRATLYLEGGACKQSPGAFSFFDDFRRFDESKWVLLQTSGVRDTTVRATGDGLLISASFTDTWQFVRIVSQPLAPPLRVDALIVPLTGYDHDINLAVYEYGSEMAHAINASGAYIHAAGWLAGGNATGRFAWYRMFGPGSNRNMWDQSTWEVGVDTTWEVGLMYILSIGVSPDGVSYKVYKVTGMGVEPYLSQRIEAGISGDVVISLETCVGGLSNVTEAGVVKWVLAGPYAYPEPLVEVGREEVEESPIAGLAAFLSRPQNQILLAWGAAVVSIALIIVVKMGRRQRH